MRITRYHSNVILMTEKGKMDDRYLVIFALLWNIVNTATSALANHDENQLTTTSCLVPPSFMFQPEKHEYKLNATQVRDGGKLRQTWSKGGDDVAIGCHSVAGTVFVGSTDKYCLVYSQRPYTKQWAETLCESGTLLQIRSQQQQDEIATQLAAQHIQAVWLGVHKKGRQWRRDSGELLQWSRLQERRGFIFITPAKNCAVFVVSSRQWKVCDCGESHPYICQYDRLTGTSTPAQITREYQSAEPSISTDDVPVSRLHSDITTESSDLALTSPGEISPLPNTDVSPSVHESPTMTPMDSHESAMPSNSVNMQSSEIFYQHRSTSNDQRYISSSFSSLSVSPDYITVQPFVSTHRPSSVGDLTTAPSTHNKPGTAMPATSIDTITSMDNVLLDTGRSTHHHGPFATESSSYTQRSKSSSASTSKLWSFRQGTISSHRAREITLLPKYSELVSENNILQLTSVKTQYMTSNPGTSVTGTTPEHTELDIGTTTISRETSYNGVDTKFVALTKEDNTIEHSTLSSISKNVKIHTSDDKFDVIITISVVSGGIIGVSLAVVAVYFLRRRGQASRLQRSIKLANTFDNGIYGEIQQHVTTEA